MHFAFFMLGLLLAAVSIGVGGWCIKHVIQPFEKFLFENSNDLGVPAFATYEESLAFKRRQAHIDLINTFVMGPASTIAAIGLFICFLSSCSYFVK